MDVSGLTLIVLRKLRPPFARSAQLLFAYRLDASAYNGITVGMPAGEPAVAAGAGTVKEIFSAQRVWPSTDPVLTDASTQHVLIDHGGSVTSLIGGLGSVSVGLGQKVARGDVIGTPLGSQLFFSIYVGRKTVNPATISSHWQPQNGNEVVGQGGFIRFSPDHIVRDLSGSVAVTLTNGIRYFTNLFSPPAQRLLNIAFNGNGSKTGAAATGSAGDFWNVYVPVDFNATVAAGCNFYSFSFYTFSSAAVLQLQDSTGAACGIILERVAPMFSAAASGASWDALLHDWIGGYVGPVPYENTFRLRNLAAGSYSLCLYAQQGTAPNASTFYVSVGNGSPTVISNSPAGATAYTQGDNYVYFNLSVPAGSYITFKAVGYLSGLQLKRTG